MKKETFGQRLKLLREQKNYTLRELADEMNISYSALGNYERNVREPSFVTIERLANFFDVDAGYLLGINNCKKAANMSIVDDLGLSEDSIIILRQLKDKNLSDTLSYIIENQYFYTLLLAIKTYRAECSDKTSTEQSFYEFYNSLDDAQRDFYGIRNAKDYEFLRFNTVQYLLEYMLNRPKDL